MVRAHSLPDMAHFITGASKAVFEHATVCPQEALTGQQDGDLDASSAHSPPGLCGRCPPPLLQLCQEDLSSFLAFFRRALILMAYVTVFSKEVFIIMFVITISPIMSKAGVIIFHTNCSNVRLVFIDKAEMSYPKIPKCPQNAQKPLKSS